MPGRLIEELSYCIVREETSGGDVGTRTTFVIQNYSGDETGAGQRTTR
jgi:hypothetical protein